MPLLRFPEPRNPKRQASHAGAPVCPEPGLPSSRTLGRLRRPSAYHDLVAEHGSKTKGAIAGVGILAAVGGGIARSADDVIFAGCRAGKTVSVAGEGASVGQFARSGAGVADDGLRGVSRAAPRPGVPGAGRGRPWMIAGAGEADDGARLGVGSTVDDLGAYKGASAVEPAEGTVGETALDLSLNLLDLSGAAEPDEPDQQPVRLEGALGLATRPFARSPRAVVVQTWTEDQDGGLPLAARAGVTRVRGRDVVRRGWHSVLEALPGADPLVMLATTRDDGATIHLDAGQSTDVSAFHRLCTSKGLHCVTVLCPHEATEPSACTASLPDIFDRAARLAEVGDVTHERFASLLGRARTTWDATTNVRIAFVKVRVQRDKEPSFVPVLTHVDPTGAD